MTTVEPIRDKKDIEKMENFLFKQANGLHLFENVIIAIAI